MASAGRILIMPKGAYDSSKTYNMLDMVSYNGTTWIAKKTVSGIEPSADNSEHWHNFADFDKNEYANKITPSDVNNRVDPNVTTLARVRTSHANCPTSDTEYMIDTVFSDSDDVINEKFQYARGTGDMRDRNYMRYKPYDGDWSAWEKVAIGGVSSFTANPAGNDYVDYTFERKNGKYVAAYASITGNLEVFVVGVNVINSDASSATVRIKLNQPANIDLSLSVGYLY